MPTSTHELPSDPMPAVLSLDDAAAADPAKCGHKAATLARLRQAGHEVPPGFVILAGRPDIDEGSLRRALAALRGKVAVRSSGLAEDLPEASFAGQYDTFLNVEGAAAVRAAVRQCVESASSTRAVAYGGGGEIAVLVQEMVDADAAGVAFSANPVTGDRDEVCVSATRGLGDRLVAGEIDGDEWSVRGEEATARTQTQRAVQAQDVERIAELARKLESELGTPVDIEWAIAEQRLVLLQARPITVLPVEPRIEVPAGTWQKDTAHFAGPITPLGSSVLRHYEDGCRAMIASWGMMPDAVHMRAIGHEVYTHAEPDDGGKNPPPWWVLGAAVRILPSLRRKLKAAQRAIDDDRLRTVPARWEAELKPQLLEEIAAHAEVSLDDRDDAKLLAHLDEIEAFIGRATTIHFDLVVPYTVGVYELVRACDELLGWDTARAMSLLQGLSPASTASDAQLEAIATLTRDNADARAAIELGGYDFFERLRETSAAIATELDRYLRGWGLRTIDYDAGTPTLAEQPALVAALLADRLAAGPVAEPPHAGRQVVLEEARAALKTPEARARFEDALRYAELVYPQREDNVLLTDNLPAGLLRRVALEIGRRLVAKGRLLRAEDVSMLTVDELRRALTDPALDVTAIVSRVRGERAWVRANPGPLVHGPKPGALPDVRGLPPAARRFNGALLWAMEEELAPAATTDGPELRGLPSSPGVATGTVRIVASSAEIHRVRPGDVVVCPTTTPAWTIIFSRAAALVTDGGSALCHAAIVAREHGIPAVVATGNATARLREGQPVRVDGNQGTVTPVG